MESQLLQAARHALEFIQSIDGYQNGKTANELRQAIEAVEHGVQATGECCCEKHYGSGHRCLQCPVHGFDPLASA